MSYTVSDNIVKAYQHLKNLEEVKAAIEFIKEDDKNTLDEQLELVVIEAPTFQENARAQAFAAKLRELGLTDVQIDRHGNAFGTRKGTSNAPAIVVEAHLDTVFPFGTVKEPVMKDGKIYCPGICDDTRGLAAVLSVLRAFNKLNIQTKSDLIFMGTAAEEGMGGLSGMKKFLDDHPEVGGCICVDGSGSDNIIFEATGIRTCAVNFHGIGGHAYGAFGKVANPLHAAARAVAKIADLKVPADPVTTFAVSNFHAGNDAGIHAIVQDATIKFNFRSNGPEELAALEKQIFAAVDEACKEETARWGVDTITYDIESYVDVPAGKQSRNAPIVEAIYTVMTDMGIEPKFYQGGSTNANMPIGKGIPALCLGGGGDSGGVHTTDEWFDPTDAYKGVQEIFYMAALLSGIEGKSDSIL